MDQGAVQGPAAPDDHAVVRGRNIGAHGPQAFRYGGDAVRFLDLELGSVSNDSLAFSCSGHDSKDRQFINQGRDQAAFNDSAPMALAACRIPARVGLVPVLRISSSDPGTRLAAAMK